MGGKARVSILVITLILSVTAALPARAQRGGEIRYESRAAQSTSATGQNGSQSMQTPLLGFVYIDSLNQLVPILGIPGASRFTDPVDAPSRTTNLYLAPGEKYAIVQRSGALPISVLAFDGAAPGPLLAIPGAMVNPDIVSFSPSGTTVALYSAAEGRIQVITGLPSTPHLARELNRSDLPEPVSTLAIADDGTTLLEGSINGAIYLVGYQSAPLPNYGQRPVYGRSPAPGMPFRPAFGSAFSSDVPVSSAAQLIYRGADLAGLVFAPRSDNALIFDRQRGAATLLENVSSEPYELALAESLTGIDGTVFLQLDSTEAIIASVNANHVWRVNLRTLEVNDEQLPTKPTMLQPLRTPGKYLLFYQPGQPAWILDASGEKPATYFVPARINAQSSPLPPSSPVGRPRPPRPVKRAPADPPRQNAPSVTQFYPRAILPSGPKRAQAE